MKWLIGGAIIGAIFGATQDTGVVGTAITCAILGLVARWFFRIFFR